MLSIFKKLSFFLVGEALTGQFSHRLRAKIPVFSSDCANVSLHVKINATKLSIERWREETGKLSKKMHDTKRQNQ